TKKDLSSPIPSQPAGNMLSDGERVVFYLIGKCLQAPSKSIIIVDEPEIHLHKAIMSKLWNALEQERNDCLFVYLTHDLEFAISRTAAKKIWLKDLTVNTGIGQNLNL